MKRKVFGNVVIVSIVILIILIVMISMFLHSPMKEKIKKLDGGDISLTYTDDINGLSALDLKPINDSVGMKLDRADMFFDFSVSVDLIEANSIDYEIAIKKDKDESTTLDENIRVYLEQQVGNDYKRVFGPETYVESDKETKFGTKKGYMSILKVNKTSSGMDNYRLRVWLSDKAKIAEGAKQNVTMKVYVTGKAK